MGSLCRGLQHMDENSRSRVAEEDALFRDRLALIQTVLANERTFLAYLRTSLALIATGVTAIHFISGQAATWLGGILVLLGFFCLGSGVLRFRLVRREIIEEAREGKAKPGCSPSTGRQCR
jgi:putative membrane protein